MAFIRLIEPDMKSGVIVKKFFLSVLVLSCITGCSFIEGALLFHPTHHTDHNGLTPWIKEGRTIGYCRQVTFPENVWLMLHGNGGQAADRIYTLPCFSERDSVYIMEYPGYGGREGEPSRASFNKAAEEAFRLLQDMYPHVPVCVAAESIGSGPAASLAGLEKKPDKLVLIVPFDRLSSVAEEHFPAILVWLVLKSDWNNMEALSQYSGPVDIFGARSDAVIPVSHAENLAASCPGARMRIISGGHNDWSDNGKVQIRNPLTHIQKKSKLDIFF